MKQTTQHTLGDDARERMLSALKAPVVSLRRKRNEPCSSLTLDGARPVWLCHHCQWSGTVNEPDDQRSAWPQRRRPAVRNKPTRTPSEAVLQWLAKRGISETTTRRNRVGAARTYIPALKREVECIAFPYTRNGELVNIKPGARPEGVRAGEGC
jgi:twinkle protein